MLSDPLRLFDLHGRNVLITGGSRGLGRMMAEGMVRSGASVYIAARKVGECHETADALSAYGQCTAIPADLSSMDGIATLARSFDDLSSRLDVLINNAGTLWVEAFDDFPETGWDKTFDLNVKAPFFMTQALAPLLRRGPDESLSKVINIGSIDGMVTNQRETYSYQASKAALVHLTKRMSIQLIDDGISVSAIIPGAFATDLTMASPDTSLGVKDRIPAGRFGQPEDIVGAAVYLASRAGDYVVGSPLVIDGGLSHVL